MSDTQSGAFSPTDARRTERPIPRPDADETADEDFSAAYCTSCERHLPHGVPDIGRVVAHEGTIPACARPDCDGIDSRSVPFESHTVAALTARRRGTRTAREGSRK